MYYHLRIGVVIPALNEAETIGQVVKRIDNLVHDRTKLVDDIVVCDNGSIDDTAKVAQAAGARVVTEPRQGYGYACFRALSALNPVDVIIFVNGDGSDDLERCADLVRFIHAGADMAIGSRFLRRSVGEKNISWHQRSGTQLLCLLVSLLWRQRITDLGPFRAIRLPVLRALNCQQTRITWLLEILLKSLNQRRRIVEIPVGRGQYAAKQAKTNDTIMITLFGGIQCLRLMGSLWWRRLRHA